MVSQGSTNVGDILDRVLDKGLVIDAWARISFQQIELLTVEARIMASSVDTYLQYAAAIGLADRNMAFEPHETTTRIPPAR
jgi:hypothetical protein